ncbi:Do/DeqQ family serine protease [Pontibacter ummariensis]|uniref:Do/DeqQ family serine protease n=1 Tax=Pontibacter ummariensis TaxID=1610492 RepID=A0A239LEI8_9BACT|nr:Do family serine endopeptidase [Pontibacter ummariensis]PRY03633.1 Do/DeqQ family serine protease [Pontibacter ummariensis]SNT28720.1 Do/DeqQ family serine protease [Pontibacter ummariensis]
MKAKQFFTGLTLSAILGGGVAAGAYKWMDSTTERLVQGQNGASGVIYTSDMRSSDVVVPDGLNFLTSARSVTPAVVHIMTESSGAGTVGSSRGGMDPFLREFFGEGFGGHMPQGAQRSSGSGVIIAADGFIVTNNHVVDGADKIKVVLNDKRTYEATLVGTDPTTDIALLKVDAERLPTARFGSSDSLQVGEWVLAVGNPMDLTSTVTAGIVSAKGRNINLLRSNNPNQRYSIESFIQTDAAVNPGNSGGALVNLNGELVGINTGIASPTGAFAGYSFAVPSSIVRKVVEDLREYGKVQRALLGGEIRDIDAAFAEEKGLKTLDGVYLANVSEHGGADDAGLFAGDVITAINGVGVTKGSQLLEQIARYRPGDEVEVTYLRGDKENTVLVTLKNMENSTELVKRSVAKSVNLMGATFQNPTEEEVHRLGIAGGVRVADLGNSAFNETGMKEGFIITHIGDNQVHEPADVERFLKSMDGNLVYLQGVYPDGLKAYYPFRE